MNLYIFKYLNTCLSKLVDEYEVITYSIVSVILLDVSFGFVTPFNQSTECTDGEAMRECFRLIVSFLFA
jgi:hypothetical protein